MLGINCIFYKRFNYNTIDYVLFSLNLLNYLFSHFIILNSLFSLFCNYNIYNLLILFFYILDFIVIYYGNKIVFLKLISRNYSLYLDAKYRKYTKIFMSLGVVISLLIATVGVVFNVIFGSALINNIFGSSLINNHFNIFYNNYALFFVLFYSSVCKINISILFFTIISNILSFLKKFIDEKIKDQNNYKIDELSIEYLIIKRNYNKTIFVFNNIIAYMITFYTFPTFYFLSNITNRYFDYSYYIGIIYYLIFCTIFQNYLSKISDANDYLNSLCTKNRSINDYISRKKNIYLFEENSIELNNINQHELNFKNYLIDIENSQSIDWIIFNEVIRQKWKDFEIFGIEINNSSIIIKIISVFLLLIIGKQII
jgi:hypothetical protein